MGNIRSLLDELCSEDLPGLTDAQLEEDFAELQRAGEIIEGERLRRLRELDRRRPWQRDGYLSTTSWLTNRFGVSGGRAADQVRLARALAEMPATRHALAAGEISSSALRVLASARDAHPEAFSAHERTLLDAARSLSVRQLQQVVAYWQQAVDSRRALEDDDSLWQRRRLHVSQTLFGTVRVDGDLDPETGETLITALRAVQDADSRASDSEDRRTPAQRRADALGEVCRQWLDAIDRPRVAGQRPHVTVTVDMEALQGRPGVLSEFDHVGPIHPEVARQWACDASVSRVITKGQSEPLDVGRRTAVVPPPMRRAVVVRDQGCRFQGCDRPHTWCDAHHVRHWADGGATALDNLVLLCRPHHRLIHRGGFRMEKADGELRFWRPDGTPLEGRAPP
ncbi:MAG: DUF222 domain-containing protein [Actinomycetota bacterium]